jgi:hypothetical protein
MSKLDQTEHPIPRIVPITAALLLAFFIPFNPGCATKPTADWNQRVGRFTFDDAVLELGPPATSIRLQDGTMVAEWFLKPGPQISFGLGSGAYGSSGGVSVGQSVAIPTPGHYLRLTFGPDGVLQHWEKVRH